jgi:hypothetical protein
MHEQDPGKENVDVLWDFFSWKSYGETVYVKSLGPCIGEGQLLQIQVELCIGKHKPCCWASGI